MQTDLSQNTETTVITDLGRNVVSDRRYRRSDEVPRALAFQCAHIRDGLNLDAMVVSDACGDRWVGAGDPRLCRIVSRSADVLAAGPSSGFDMRVKALRSIRADLRPGDITTFQLTVPGTSRNLYVTGVGGSRLRDDGVVNAAGGVRRIMGWQSAAAGAVPTAAHENPQAVLERLTRATFEALRVSGELTGEAPRRVFGRTDDSVYAPTLGHVLSPALNTIENSGLEYDNLSRAWTWRSRERSRRDGTYVRTFKLNLREVRTGIRVGRLDVDFYHRHDRFEIPYCPVLTLRWT